MFNTQDIAKFPEAAFEQTRKMIDDATKQADEMRVKFESIIKDGFDPSNFDAANFNMPRIDIPGVDAEKFESDMRSFIENVMGYTLVTRREFADLEARVEKAEKALAKKPSAKKKAAAKAKPEAKKSADKAVAETPAAGASA